jgi:signal transduction histidine kinase
MVDDYQQSPYANRALVEHAGSRAVIAEPLLYRERLIGVLIVGPGTPGHRFTAADRDLLALLAAQATIAIENARLFEDSTRRQAWLTTILDINKRIATNEDMASLLAQIAEEAVRFIGADGTILRLLRGDQLVAMGATPYGPTLADVPETRLGEGIVGRAALENRVFMVPDVQACPDISPYRKRRAAEFGINSMVCIPVCDRHHVLGVLSITSKQPRVFTADETMVISAYAEQCAIAIEHARLLAAQATIAMENAKLYEQVRQYAGDLEAQVAVRTRELQETNQQLAAASRHKSAFLANVSHELRTPLTAVKGSVDNMLDGLTGAVNDKQRRYLTRIQANTDRLARLIHDLLDLARIEAGKSDLQPASLPVVALTHEVVEYLGPMAAEKHICLEVAAADASVTAWADREKVTQVLMNLMGNALKFTPAHGTVVIAIHRSDDAWVQIAVTDTGPGIPAAEATHIFEQFYQIATAGRQKTTGTGLGLAIAKSLVEMQGGQLWVESAVGRGSTFAFTLPCSTH